MKVKRMKRLCDRLAAFIARRSAREDDDIEVISYGLQGILGTVMEFALIILSGKILGMLKETLVMSATFVTLRLMAGGVHFSTYNRCLVSSVLIFVFGGFGALGCPAARFRGTALSCIRQPVCSILHL